VPTRFTQTRYAVLTAAISLPKTPLSPLDRR
jgi:hypothetical protein